MKRSTSHLSVTCLILAAFVSCGAAQAEIDFTDSKVEQVKLPAKIGDRVIVAGGGRYLVFFMPERHEVGLFDIRSREIAGTIAVDEGAEVCFAGSRDRLVVYTGVTEEDSRGRIKSSKGKLSKYRLPGLEVEQSVDWNKKVTSIGLGYSSDGPVVVGDGRYGRFLWLKNLKEFNVHAPDDPKADLRRPKNFGDFIHVSANGRVITSNDRIRPTAFPYLRLDEHGRQLATGKRLDGRGFVRPDPDGEFIYTSQRILTFSGARYAYSTSWSPDFRTVLAFVTPELTKGNVYLKYKTFTKAIGRTPQVALTPTLTLHARGQTKTMVKLDPKAFGLRPYPDLNRKGRAMQVHEKRDAFVVQPWHERIFVNSAEKAIVAVDDDRTRLNIATLDVSKLLKQAVPEPLAITSRPNTSFAIWEGLNYRPNVVSIAGGVQLKLIKGPEGMKFENGVLHWAAPGTSDGKSFPVEIAASDSSGATVQQKFTLNVDKPVMLKPHKYRIWTDATGEHKTDAAFAGFAREKIRLKKKSDGKTVHVPYTQLSGYDKDVIDRWAEAGGVPRAGDAEKASKDPKDYANIIRLKVQPIGRITNLSGGGRDPHYKDVDPRTMGVSLTVQNMGKKKIIRLLVRCTVEIPGIKPESKIVELAGQRVGYLLPNKKVKRSRTMYFSRTKERKFGAGSVKTEIVDILVK